jgi:hypothetical protein
MELAGSSPILFAPVHATRPVACRLTATDATIEQFTASTYKPANWAHPARDMGAKCTALTARHHNGLTPRPSSHPNTVVTLDQAHRGTVCSGDAFCPGETAALHEHRPCGTDFRPMFPIDIYA